MKMENLFGGFKLRLWAVRTNIPGLLPHNPVNYAVTSQLLSEHARQFVGQKDSKGIRPFPLELKGFSEILKFARF